MNRLLLLLLLLPGVCLAHSPKVDVGFGVGLLHPVLGLDHLIAMVSVGILSTLYQRRAIWQIPLTFVAAMTLAAIAGMYELDLPGVERGIAASVLMIGLAIAFQRTLGYIAAVFFTAFFAVFHGYAHGVEIPSLANPVLYAAGFMLGTSVLHIAGIVLSLRLLHLPIKPVFQQVAGGAIVAVGLMLMLHRSTL